MFNLLEIDFKVTIIHMLKKLKKIMCKELKESMRMISHQTENINKVIEMIKETQIEFLEMGSRITSYILYININILYYIRYMFYII